MTLDPLIVDRYAPDGPVDVDALVNAGAPWHGLCLKLCQGTYPDYSSAEWAAQLLARARRSARWNRDFFGRLYVYLNFSEPGIAQADYALDLIAKHAGLDGAGMLPLMVDVERGGQRPAMLTRQHVEDVTGEFGQHYFAATGRRCTLYTGELARALGITSHMECDRLAVAAYGAHLPPTHYTSIGWDWPDEWQYCGTEPVPAQWVLAGYPVRAPGCSGLSDISVVTAKSGLSGLSALAS